MSELLIRIDHSLFLFINHLPHNFILDGIFSFFSFVGFYGAIWIILALILFLFDRIKNQREIITLMAVVFMELILIELVLKNFFVRMRPELIFPEAIKVLPPSITYSFPSGHAAIGFASASILSANRKKMAILFYILAFLIAFSRIYLGKHYPIDVLVGALIGLVIGFISIKITKQIKFKEYF